MTQINGNTSPYKPFEGKDISIPDNNFGTPEFVFRDCLNHVYEAGFKQGKGEEPTVSFPDLLCGAASALFFDGVITWHKKSSPAVHFFFCIVCLILFLVLVKKKTHANKKMSVFSERDNTVDEQVKNLAERTRSRTASVNPEKQNDGGTNQHT